MTKKSTAQSKKDGNAEEAPASPPAEGDAKEATVSYTAYGGGAGGPPPSFSDPALPGGAVEAAAAADPAATSTPTKKAGNPNAGADASPYVSPWKMTGSMYPGSPWGTDRNGAPPPYPPPPPGYPAFAGHPPQFWGPRPHMAMPRMMAGPAGGVALKLPTTGNSKQPHGGTPDDRRGGASSPSEIEDMQRKDVQHMGCTCKKTRCLKLYCQCFAVQVDCQSAICRCLDCHNLPAQETARAQARGSILQRNPQAFSTKFQKDGGNNMQAAALTHKLGCKCRKSACMKKYCECFAGNVNCNNHCRCTGCKNRGGAVVYAVSEGSGQNRAFFGGFPHPTHVMQPVGSRGGETGGSAAKPTTTHPYTAAQNLTFLKHAASSGGGGSPEGEPKSKKARPEPDPEAMDPLMMAAYAMTEFGQGSSPSKARLPPKKAAAEAAKIATAPTPQKLKDRQAQV